MKQGKRSTSTKKFLPSYILIEMDLDKETQNLVVQYAGNHQFCRRWREAAAAPTGRGASGLSVRSTGAATEEVADVPFQAGDPVKVKDGPFTDFSRHGERSQYGAPQSESDGFDFRPADAGGTRLSAGGTGQGQERK